MQPSVFSWLAPGQWTLFKWQRFLVAQGQRGAWCKAGESGGSSESLLRQWQRFLVRFSFVTGWGEWGPQCNCVASALQTGGAWFLWQSRDTCHTLELLVVVWAAGTFGRWEGVWSPSLCCRRDLQLCLWMLWGGQPQILWHPGRGFRLPHACSETMLHLWWNLRPSVAFAACELHETKDLQDAWYCLEAAYTRKVVFLLV